MSTPHVQMRLAIPKVLATPKSDSTTQAIRRSAQKRTRVHSKGGEILTEDDVMARLYDKSMRQIKHP